MSADLSRLLQNLIRVGTVEAVKDDKAQVSFEGDVDWKSEFLPWCVRRAHGDIEWWAPEVGEQVVVLSPGGVTEDGFIAWSLYQSDHPAPENSADKHVVKYANGASMTHDRSSGSYTLDLMGKFIVNAPSGFEVNAPDSKFSGNTDVAGKSDVGGAIKAGGDVTGGDVSLQNHRHKDGDGAATSVAIT